jgi:hypothetical protein
MAWCELKFSVAGIPVGEADDEPVAGIDVQGGILHAVGRREAVVGISVGFDVRQVKKGRA